MIIVEFSNNAWFFAQELFTQSYQFYLIWILRQIQRKLQFFISQELLNKKMYQKLFIDGLQEYVQKQADKTLNLID